MTAVLTSTAGYALYVRCGHDHEGNRGLIKLRSGTWACRGCQACVSEPEVDAAQVRAIADNCAYIGGQL
jgi:hypothetical protein